MWDAATVLCTGDPRLRDHCGEAGASSSPPSPPQRSISTFTFCSHGTYTTTCLAQPLSGPFALTGCRDCNDGALFTLGLLVWEAGPGAGGCSCSTLQLRDLPNLGRVPWPKANKNFFSPRVVMLLLAFLFLSEGAAERGPGPALTPGRSLKCKSGHEVGGRGLWKRGRTSLGFCGPQMSQYHASWRNRQAGCRKEG